MKAQEKEKKEAAERTSESKKKEANKHGILCLKAMTITYTVYRLTGQREVRMCRLASEVHPATRIICNIHTRHTTYIFAMLMYIPALNTREFHETVLILLQPLMVVCSGETKGEGGGEEQ